jgi:predicted nicotinamide N-methyase
VPSYHRDFYDSDNYKMETEIVPMKAIHLTSQNLTKLVAEQEHLQRLGDEAKFGNRLWAQEREDGRVRDSNPAVEKAYQKYMMLLELARK